MGNLIQCSSEYRASNKGLCLKFSSGFFDNFRVRRSTDTYDKRLLCDSTGHHANHATIVYTVPRVNAIKEELKNNKIDAIIIPAADEHQSEYVAPVDERREFVTGFSGSAGTAVLLQNSSAEDRILWTDSRYTVQADQQLDCNWKIVTTGATKPTPSSWLKEHLPEGSRVAADPRLFGAEEWDSMKTSLKYSNIMLVEDPGKIIDPIWERKFSRPSLINSPIYIHPIEYAGRTWKDKIRDIAKDLKKSDVQMFVVTALDEVAWLLNLRGRSIPHTPVFFCYVVIEVTSSIRVSVFLHYPDKTSSAIRKHLDIGNCSNSDICVSIRPYEEIGGYLHRAAVKNEVSTVYMSKPHPYSKGVSYYIFSKIPLMKRKLVLSPVLIAKAQKTQAESEAMEQSQLRDSVVLVEFLSFLEREVQNGKQWTELSAAKYLSKLRAKEKHAKGDSFETISAFGTNGAIVHYTPTNNTDKQITTKSMYLLDSGGQYLDGTTDVTRTLHYGKPTKEQIQAYTLVAQGSIDLAGQIFPKRMKDNFIDVIARRHLYQEGLNYGHGTGHGIGFFLSVHEGPTLLAMRKEGAELKKGYFFSDEPGYYKRNDFGIRIENILEVVESPVMNELTNEHMLEFKVHTLVPFEPILIDMTRFTAKECEHLRNYNQIIRQKAGPLLLERGSNDAYNWMLRKTPTLDCDFGYNISPTKSKPFLLIYIIIPMLFIYT